MRVRKNPWRLARKSLAILICTVVIVGGIIGLALYITRDTNPIPADIQSGLTFTPLVIPSDHKDIQTTNYRLSRGEDNTQLLEYTILWEENRIVVTTSVQPPQFSDIPEYKERFLSNIVQQTATVPTANGTIYLGQLSKQDNAQLGVLVERGLLLFMKPDAPLAENDWRTIGDSLMLARTNSSR